MLRRPIAISLSPNTEYDDVWLALKTLLQPWKWLDQKQVSLLEGEFESKFPSGYRAIATNSGRGAEQLILKALDIKKGDEVIVQAFTCIAVPNSIISVGAKPVYVDIDETYNIDPEDLIKKISPKTKVVIVQHTFGIPAQMDKIRKITKKNT